MLEELQILLPLRFSFLINLKSLNRINLQILFKTMLFHFYEFTGFVKPFLRV